MPGASRPDRRARVNDAGAIQASSMEVWPAARGGLLLGMIVPALAGAVSLRHPIKNLFLYLDRQGKISIVVRARSSGSSAWLAPTKTGPWPGYARSGAT